MINKIEVAGRLAIWLEAKGARAVCTTMHQDRIEVHYTLRDDIKPQPAIRIESDKIVIPKGTDEGANAAILEAIILGTI